MRYLFSVLLILGLFSSAGYAQAPVNYANLYAKKVAQRMKDSLSITDQQKNQVYELNMNLFAQKKIIWQTYTSRDSVQVHIQALEDTRDGLYRAILTDSQYALFLQKRHNLLNNN